MKNLTHGSLVASDDYILLDGRLGKGAFVKEFLDDIGAHCLHEGYQLIYEL
jgi:hypothetical protein